MKSFSSSELFVNDSTFCTCWYMHRSFGGKRGHPPRSGPPDQNERPPDRMLQTTNLKYKQKSEEILLWKYIPDFLTLPSCLSFSFFLFSSSFLFSLSPLSLSLFIWNAFLPGKKEAWCPVWKFRSCESGAFFSSRQPPFACDVIDTLTSLLLSRLLSFSLALILSVTNEKKKLSRCLGFRHFFLLPFTNYIRQIIVYTWTDTDPTDMTISCHEFLYEEQTLIQLTWQLHVMSFSMRETSAWMNQLTDNDDHLTMCWPDPLPFIHVTHIQSYFFLSLSI